MGQGSRTAIFLHSLPATQTDLIHELYVIFLHIGCGSNLNIPKYCKVIHTLYTLSLPSLMLDYFYSNGTQEAVYFVVSCQQKVGQYWGTGTSASAVGGCLCASSTNYSLVCLLVQTHCSYYVLLEVPCKQRQASRTGVCNFVPGTW